MGWLKNRSETKMKRAEQRLAARTFEGMVRLGVRVSEQEAERLHDRWCDDPTCTARTKRTALDRLEEMERLGFPSDMCVVLMVVLLAVQDQVIAQVRSAHDAGIETEFVNLDREVPTSDSPASSDENAPDVPDDADTPSYCPEYEAEFPRPVAPIKVTSAMTGDERDIPVRAKAAPTCTCGAESTWGYNAIARRTWRSTDDPSDCTPYCDTHGPNTPPEPGPVFGRDIAGKPLHPTKLVTDRTTNADVDAYIDSGFRDPYPATQAEVSRMLDPDKPRGCTMKDDDHLAGNVTCPACNAEPSIADAYLTDVSFTNGPPTKQGLFVEPEDDGPVPDQEEIDAVLRADMSDGDDLVGHPVIYETDRRGNKAYPLPAVITVSHASHADMPLLRAAEEADMIVDLRDNDLTDFDVRSHLDSGKVVVTKRGYLVPGNEIPIPLDGTVHLKVTTPGAQHHYDEWSVPFDARPTPRSWSFLGIPEQLIAQTYPF